MCILNQSGPFTVFSRHLFLKAIGLLLFAILALCDAHAVERHALVIGNSEYKETPLKNPINDAQDMAQVLSNLGYQVYSNKAQINLNQTQMEDMLFEFSQQLPEDAVALFYYAGHGANDDRGNSYLIPLASNIRLERHIRSKALSLSYVASTMQTYNSKGLNILLIDACRDRPFGRSFSRSATRGLKRLNTLPRGTFIGLAAAEGQVAEDGEGRNGVYTRYLLEALRESAGERIEEIHKGVAESVYNATSRREEPQRPVYQSDYFGTYCFDECRSESVLPPLRTGRLWVKTEPEGARVRIMNIVPKYEEGMELDLGKRYDILVTREGYKGWRKSVELDESEEVVAVVLEKLAELPLSPVAVRVSAPRRASYEPEMVVITGGRFMMGSPASEGGRDGDEKQHEVVVRSFKLSKYEATFAEYDAFAKATGRDLPGDRGWGRGSRPVIYVSWNDATAYAQWLSKKTGKAYRLPTEAEWEYAARAGGQRAYSWGSSIGKNRANCDGCGSQWDGKKTAPVGSFAGNDWGLYGLHGNVREWTCSAYVKNYNGSESQCSGQKNSVTRALRGGSWYGLPSSVRAANRTRYWPDTRNFNLGFRLAQDN